MTPAAPSANQAQIELWNGRGGEIWTRLQRELDRLFEPLTAALLQAAAIKPGESIVEIGCGCGDLTLSVAKASGWQGQVTAVDISTRMLEHAKGREQACRSGANGMAPIAWCEADAMLHAFEPRADLVISRFGVMFFADPVKAFRNIKTALKPNGRLALLSWASLDQNPWIHVPLKAVHRLIEPPAPLPEGTPGPFAFAEAARVIRILNDAGFANVTSHLIECPVSLGRASEGSTDPIQSAIDDALLLALESGPVAALLRDADENLRAHVRDEIAATLHQHIDVKQQAVTFMAACQIYLARAS
jgi:SAM-dependent methyltransferase